MDITQTTAEELVAGVTHLVSLPDIYMRLEETLESPHHTLNDVCSIISVDPSLSARVLKVVNSSFYALPNRVKSISIAVNLIGEDEIRNMVFVVSMVNATALLVKNDFDLLAYWKHSIRCAIAAKLLSRRVTGLDENVLFLSGLLCDVGQLVIYMQDHNAYELINKAMQKDGIKRFQAEQLYLGFDHSIIGALLIEAWNLPAKVCESIKHHHDVELSTQYQIETKILSLGDQFAHFSQSSDYVDDFNLGSLPTVLQAFLIEMEIDEEEFLSLVSYVKEQSQAIEEMILSIH